MGYPKKTPLRSAKITNEMIKNYCDNDTSELYKIINSGCRFDTSEITMQLLIIYNKNFSNISYLAKILPYTNITYLVIGNNKISDISELYDVLPYTKINRL